MVNAKGMQYHPLQRIIDTRDCQHQLLGIYGHFEGQIRASGITERAVKRDKSSRRGESYSQGESAKRKAVGPSQEGIVCGYNARERKES